jgi:hypothetical protein
MVVWQQQEPGWYTSERGGICQGRDGKWYWYPSDNTSVRGPWPSMWQAKKAAEECCLQEE